MYHFQSLGRNVDVCGLPGEPTIKFRNYEFATDDERQAERIRKNSCFGREYWEDNIQFDVSGVAIPKEEPRKRGRPAKVKIVSGARTAGEIQGE